MTLIHYGSDTYNPEMFKPIENIELYNKPTGGLWACPENSINSWADLCNYRKWQDRLTLNFKIELNMKSGVLKIDSYQSFLQCWETYGLDEIGKIIYALDFEAMSKQYSAFWLTDEGEVQTKFTQPGLRGWDCETVLIMNPYCFKAL